MLLQLLFLCFCCRIPFSENLLTIWEASFWSLENTLLAVSLYLISYLYPGNHIFKLMSSEMPLWKLNKTFSYLVIPSTASYITIATKTIRRYRKKRLIANHLNHFLLIEKAKTSAGFCNNLFDSQKCNKSERHLTPFCTKHTVWGVILTQNIDTCLFSTLKSAFTSNN